MIRKIALPGCALAVAFAAACTTTEGGSSASSCGGSAYQNVFGGGDFYSVETRSQVSGILRNETDPNGAISPDAERRLVNALGADGAAAVAQSYAQCMRQAQS